MITPNFLKTMLQRPTLSGVRALLVGIPLVAVPSLIAVFVDGSGAGLAFVVYFPSVVIAALVMRGWQAAMLALACAAAGDWFFLEESYQLTVSTNDLLGIPLFLIASALIIAAAQTMRAFIEEVVSPSASSGKLIFSEEKEQAWAHWHDRPSVRLGSHTEVAEMMKDYLAQVEFGKQLARRKRKP